MSDRAKEIRSKLSAASYIVENLPEYPGYNGSAFVIDEIEKDRIVKDLDEAIAFVESAQAQAGERKCSECGNGEPDLSLYCVRCLNNDGWYLTDDAQAQAGDGEAVGWLVMIDGDYKFFESYDDALDARKHEEYWNKGIEHAAPRPVYAAPPAAVNQQLLAEWLQREMPAGTVISDPAWWAPRIIKAIESAQEHK